MNKVRETHSQCSLAIIVFQEYGPTFTTGDIIGCGLNMVQNSIFYTKNGQNLGNAFINLPTRYTDFYPTIGLCSPGEIVQINFGQEPFVFDIETAMDEIPGLNYLRAEELNILNNQFEQLSV